MTEKPCSKCRVTKDLSEFSPNPRGLGGRTSVCKGCNVLAETARRKARPDIYAARRKVWYAKKGARYQREWLRAHPDTARAMNFKQKLRRYGLTSEAFHAMLAAQCGRCGSCGGPPDGKWRSFNVDHDHETGFVRGLLCTGCNTSIGLMGESVERLEKLIAYLVRHHAQKRRTA